MSVVKHGGGPSGKVTVGDTVEVIAATDPHRKYLEIQNNGDALLGNSNRVYLSISNTIDAVVDSGLFLEPGAVYTVAVGNLTPARITAICDAGKSSDVYFQIGR
jgi:hypothetical protein